MEVGTALRLTELGTREGGAGGGETPSRAARCTWPLGHRRRGELTPQKHPRRPVRFESFEFGNAKSPPSPTRLSN